ncbi:unnamed protein product [Phaedon cochleariae]|uniref:Uncharacterized protein n=1 Tax=Phaedon cochleariae TaxID=80249 RepID=A0A9N9S991_PHACE|nr:unnamed protein product [Phaedon cochleariae]
MDPSLYNERRGGLPLHELLAALEDDIVDSADIYITPPQDGEETDQDSDLSDDDHEGNINHLGPATLKAEAEVILHRTIRPSKLSNDDEVPSCSHNSSKPPTPHKMAPSSSMQDSSDDDLPLSSFIQSNQISLDRPAKKQKPNVLPKTHESNMEMNLRRVAKNKDEMKYLEKGHTPMEVDSVHSTIEKRLKNRDIIYSPYEYIAVCKEARRRHPYHVKYMKYTDFKEFSEIPIYYSIRPGRKPDFEKVVIGELTLLNLKINAMGENVSTILSFMRQNTNTAMQEPDLFKKIKIFNSKLPLKSNEGLEELED